MHNKNSMTKLSENNVFLITNHVNKYIKENCEKYDIPYITHEIKTLNLKEKKLYQEQKEIGLLVWINSFLWPYFVYLLRTIF